MISADWLLIAIVLALVLAATAPLGRYIEREFLAQKLEANEGDSRFILTKPGVGDRIARPQD